MHCGWGVCCDTCWEVGRFLREANTPQQPRRCAEDTAPLMAAILPVTGAKTWMPPKCASRAARKVDLEHQPQGNTIQPLKQKQPFHLRQQEPRSCYHSWVGHDRLIQHDRLSKEPQKKETKRKSCTVGWCFLEAEGLEWGDGHA